MSDAQNWRTEINARDYLGHQKKQNGLADRRPVPRKPEDLGMGPGFGANTTRITDFNDTIATFNGFYSAGTEAFNKPTIITGGGSGQGGSTIVYAGPFVGFIASDAEFGGVQQFVDLATGTRLMRLFMRAPASPSTLTWGAWSVDS